MTIVVKVTTVGIVTNTATVSATESDPNPANNTAIVTTIVYGGFVGGGSFVIGNLSTTGTVYFWGSQWASNNSLGGGSAPNAFKGFAKNPATPACGTTWSTDPGNSAPPPPGRCRPTSP